MKTLTALIPALLYVAFAGFANPLAAQAVDAELRAELEALREGDLRKLVIHSAAPRAPDIAFVAPNGAPTTLAASNGRIRVVNLWATWCAPCREEMPALDALQRDLGGADFAVIPIATGRNSPDGIARFWREAGIAHMETALDPKSALASELGVPGLPVTLILDRGGVEVARLLGGADWAGPSARAILERLIATP